MPIVLDEIAGMPEALAAVQLVGGVLLDPRAAHQLVVAAWYAAEPAARAAAFADAADLLYDLADAWKSPEYYSAAFMLDTMAHEMRSPQ
jgi:predicted dienelactone hydrolase